jgi:hypothetical protein
MSDAMWIPNAKRYADGMTVFFFYIWIMTPIGHALVRLYVWWRIRRVYRTGKIIHGP